MFLNIKLNESRPIYIQIYNSIKDMVESGMLIPGSKLPSSRELADLLKISRVTALNAYEKLEEKNLIYSIRGKGTFVSEVSIENERAIRINYTDRLTKYACEAEKLDIMKHEVLYKKGMISFKSIAPDETLFDIDEVKRSFLFLTALEGEKILNYGYARGYKPLIEWITDYMKKKGVFTEDKGVLITNGFTEGFDLILSALLNKGDTILCENPTHNTAIKQMKLHGLKIKGINMTKDGMNLEQLQNYLNNETPKAAYIIPSYHNPTGIVMPYESRLKLHDFLGKFGIPVIEDGFNEELQHLGTHIAPMASIGGRGNTVIYVGSFSKILFPGMRLGWILADKKLIDSLESIKRSRNIHTSFLDQGILYHYMKSGSFEKYIKKVRGIYREKFDLALELSHKFIPNEYIRGDGGLYFFIKLKNVNARELLDRCYKRGVIFTPGDIFYTENPDSDTLRLGFSRLSLKNIQDGIDIIGQEVQTLI